MTASDLQPLSLVAIVALTVVALACVVLVLWPGYDDNLLQRLGAAVVCLSVCSMAMHIYTGHSSDRPIFGLVMGSLTISLGTWLKLRRQT